MATVWAPIQATTASQAGSQPLPRRIHLPDVWQPEGITTDGNSLFVGSLRNGAIWQANPLTGDGEVLARGRKGRVAVGVDHDARRDLLWVAGGATGKIRAQDAHTGRVVARYSFGQGRFLNDLVVTRRAVYATDSSSAELAVVPLRRGDGLPRPDRATTLDLTGDFALVENQFNLNGIVRARGWLLAVQSVNGRLFRINPNTGTTRALEVRGARLVNGDGLERDGDILYVVRNMNNKVVALDLNRRLTEARRLAVLRHRSLDIPSTAALVDDALWVVNARFTTPPTPTTPYWVTRLRAVHR
ncbi:MAG: superoxide dismutase [Nocardioidaceae bacterium]